MRIRSAGIAIMVTCVCWALLTSRPAAAQNYLTSSPAHVDFGYTFETTTPQTASLTIVKTRPSTMIVQRTYWSGGKSPTGFTFTGLPVPGDEIGDPTVISYTYSFPQPAYINSTLIIEALCTDSGDNTDPALGLACDQSNPSRPVQTVYVTFTAKVDCINIDENCRPKGPECIIDFNNENYVFFPAPDLSKQVSEPLTDLNIKQYSGFKEYQLPLDTLISISGMTSLFGPINSNSCLCDSICSTPPKDTCQPDINFLVNFQYPSFSLFSWESVDGSPVTIKSKSNPLFDATITIPPRVTGSAQISASFAEFFYSNAAEAVRLRLDYIGPDGDYQSGVTLFDGPILCSKAAINEAVTRHPTANGQPPTVHLRAAESIVSP